jgi:hypothetical protein
MSEKESQDLGDAKLDPAQPAIPKINSKPRWTRWLFVAFFLLFTGIQAIQPDKNNNDVSYEHDISSIVSLPDSVKTILQIACYDCHSNNTQYPWYTNIQPGGWWLARHVREGKRQLNFDEFTKPLLTNKQAITKDQLKQLDKIKHTVEEGEMPLPSYRLLHREARLSGQQKKQIVDWVDRAKNEITSTSKQTKKQ